MEATGSPQVGLVTISEVQHPEDYAAHTRGLPKTNFDEMREIGWRLVDTSLSAKDFPIAGGSQVGLAVVQACEGLEHIMEKAKYNAFGGARDKVSSVYIAMRDMLMDLANIYLMRNHIRGRDMPLDAEYSRERFSPPVPSNDELKALFSSLSELSRRKDAEYGASWCKRGGIGAWFTTVRKFDRLVTQLRQKEFNIWDVSDDVDSTESLEETIKDGINYLLLILEKRQVIRFTEG